MSDDPLYFPDPEAAVERIDALLAAADWETLARYYDLAESDLAFEDVARWEWFDHGGQPVADPRGRTGPHHPFPPGARYRGHTVDDGTARVVVEADPALADTLSGPPERVFFVVRHDEGWQLLAPDDARLYSRN